MTTENMHLPEHDDLGRRKFIYNLATVAGAGVALSVPGISKAASFIKPVESYTVKQIMDLFISQVPGGVKSTTVDTLKSGNPDIVVTGIVTTMFATIEVIRKAIDLGANFIIAHEPTFYNHADDTAWLANDEVYQYKAKLLKDHNIAVWRNHDYIHTMRPDPVGTQSLKQLGWLDYVPEKTVPFVVDLPATSLKNIVSHLKEKLHIKGVRYIGDPAQICKKAVFMIGAPGGQRQILAAGKIKPDVLILGEIQEWETAEYVRDARAKGDNLALILMGHIASEEPGSEFMRDWMNKNVPGMKVTHISPGNSLDFM